MALYNFRDDYSDGAHPEILEALINGNASIQTSYGEDAHTENARNLIKEKMKAPDADVHFVVSGTLANIVAIGSCLRPHEAVIAVSSGHIVVRETGAIEALGHKIITVPPVEGKLTVAGIKQALKDNSHYPHMAKPRLVYISNATEVGTLYTKAELSEIAEICKQHKLILYLDGARLGAALSSEENDLTLEEIGHPTDIFWIGGTKVGALLGEAIVINNPVLQEDFRFHLKQRGGLLAKGRVLGLQFEALFGSDLFFKLAANTNVTAKALSAGIERAGCALAHKTITNQVFAIFPDAVIAKLESTSSFYVWEELGDGTSVVRLVTSWATQSQDVEGFLAML
ncbi:threonine aldolase [Colletotrichum simmondsii]|uniref:Threonine aldolase n=1 Tax=Colletotrichum simmondsii TaxID=703756 RepID=A0A135SHT4_9PEZI|nr:threonine aldolase [Colletotrichum simmondsii]